MSQALLKKIAAIQPIQVGDDTYLSYDVVLTETANHLFPDGPQSESDFQQITEQAGRLLTQLGYGSPVPLNPPAIPFNQRGTYYRKMPQLDTVVVQAALEQIATLSNSKPEQRVIAPRLMLNVAKRLGHGGFDHLESGLREHITNQVHAFATNLGWTFYDSGLFAKPLPFDSDKAKTAVSTHLTKTDGPVWHSDLLNTAVSAGYGHSFYYLEEPEPTLEEVILATLTDHNYETTQADSSDSCYRPKLPALPTDTQQQLLDGLRQMQTYSIDDKHNRDMLHADEVQELLNQLLGQSTTEYQFRRFLTDRPLANALMQLGYETDTTTLPTDQIRPFTDRFNVPNIYHPFLRKVVVTPTNDPPQILQLADGMTVHAPIITLDDDEETIIALQMIGPEQAVKANWAALMGGSKTNWINATRIKLGGAKSHITLRQMLPCGWMEMWLIHKRSSHIEMTPDEPFYLLDDGTAVPPPNFFLMLDRSIQVPLQPEWTNYLWLHGRQADLIRLATDQHSRGRAAWRVITDLDGWSTLITTGLQNDQLTF